MSVVPKEFYDSNFIAKYANEKICFNVKLLKFFVIQNIYDKSEIQKKVLKSPKILTNFYAKNGDFVSFTLKCTYKNTQIFERKNEGLELDKALESGVIFEVERRILENVRKGEHSIVTVLPVYMKAKNVGFLERYKIDNTEPIMLLKLF